MISISIRGFRKIGHMPGITVILDKLIGIYHFIMLNVYFVYVSIENKLELQLYLVPISEYSQ